MYENTQDILAGSTALHQAARAGNERVVTLLLERGAAVNEKDGTGSTALDFATQGGRWEVAALLLEYGAAVSERTNDGSTLGSQRTKPPWRLYMMSHA